MVTETEVGKSNVNRFTTHKIISNNVPCHVRWDCTGKCTEKAEMHLPRAALQACEKWRQPVSGYIFTGSIQ